MYNETVKELNKAVADFTTDATKRTIELQTSLFKEWVALNKILVSISPAKEFFAAFKG